MARAPSGSGEGNSFQELILKLQTYWSGQGCAILQPYDMSVGAGTFHPATTLRALGPEPWSAAYDIHFVEDDWESPTLGAWGLGWEVWCDGMEVTQFTYFQQVGGFDCNPVSGEITYGLERLAMYVQGVENVYDLDFNGHGLTYGDVFKQAEREFSTYNFEKADTALLFRHFGDAEKECAALIGAGLPLPAYDQCIQASHTFNLLDARGVISVTERAAYIGRVRALARGCAEAWLKARGHLAEAG